MSNLTLSRLVWFATKRAISSFSPISLATFGLSAISSWASFPFLAMNESCAFTIAKDEESSIVWGMPKEAIDLGAASEVLPLDGIVQRLKRHFS